MVSRETLKRVLGYWPICLFALLVLVRYWGVLWSDLFFSFDHIAGYPMREYVLGEFPKPVTFIPHILGGIRTIPMTWLQPLTSLDAAFGMALASFVGCCGVWWLVRGWAGVFGGIAWGFTGSMVSLVYAGHGGKMLVMGIFPWLFWCVGDLRRRWWILGILGWVCLSLHTQMAYYSAIFLTVYFLFKHRGEWRRFLLSGLVAGVLFAPQFLITRSIVKDSAREGGSYERGVSFSMPPEEVMCVIDPTFKGQFGEYWGRRVIKQHTEYMTAVVFLMALVGLCLKWEWWVMGLVSLVFSFGGYTPIYKFIYMIPPNGMFRSPGMAFFGFVFAVVMFSIYGARKVKWLAMILGVVVFLDLWAGTVDYTVPMSFEQAYGDVRDCAEFIQKDKSDFRIFTPHFEIADNRFMLWGIKSLNGYYPFPRKAFVDSVGGSILPDFSKMTLRTAKDYGVKYVVAKNGPVEQLLFTGKNYNVYGLP